MKAILLTNTFFEGNELMRYFLEMSLHWKSEIMGTFLKCVFRCMHRKTTVCIHKPPTEPSSQFINRGTYSLTVQRALCYVTGWKHWIMYCLLIPGTLWAQGGGYLEILPHWIGDVWSGYIMHKGHALQVAGLLFCPGPAEAKKKHPKTENTGSGMERKTVNECPWHR